MKASLVAFGFLVLAIIVITDAGITGKPKIDDSITNRKGKCPPSLSLRGNCTFDPKINCLSDEKCLDKTHKCCREGCNKICMPIISIPANIAYPDFGAYYKWKAQKLKEWNIWANETKKTIMGQLAGLWEIATPSR